MAQMLRLLEPVAPEPQSTSKLSPRLPDVRGKKIGFRVAWPRFAVFMDKVEGVLRERYGIGPVSRISGAVSLSVTQTIALHGKQKEEWAAWHGASDAAILGLAA